MNRVLCRNQARLRRFGSPVILGVALSMLVAFEGRADLFDDLSRASKQLELLETKANLIQNQYLQFSDPKSKSRLFESRLNDGQALMLLKDYVRAAIVFYDLVENEEYKKHVGYTDAVFSYAEALFFNKNFIDARKYFLQVIDSQRGRPYRKVALVRLMQIALNTEDYAVVDDAHRKLVEGSSKSSPEAEYLFFRPQNLVLVRFEFIGDVSFAIDQGLFSNVVVGNFVRVDFGHFDVITENLVVLHFELGNIGLLSFSGLDLCQHAPRIPSNIAQFVEFIIHI